MGLGGDDDKLENGSGGGGGFFESFKVTVWVSDCKCMYFYDLDQTVTQLYVLFLFYGCLGQSLKSFYNFHDDCWVLLTLCVSLPCWGDTICWNTLLLAPWLFCPIFSRCVVLWFFLLASVSSHWRHIDVKLSLSYVSVIRSKGTDRPLSLSDTFSPPSIPLSEKTCTVVVFNLCLVRLPLLFLLT